MTKLGALENIFKNPTANKELKKLYGSDEKNLLRQSERYIRVLDQFRERFHGKEEVEIFVAPGRTEVGGNHTDHNAGRVLAAAVDLDIIAAVAPNDRNVIRIFSEGFSPVEVDLEILSPVDDEKYSSSALARGVCARAEELGFSIGGYDACMSGTVPDGSGLSSSAAFEVLNCAVISEFYNGSRIDAITKAQIGQYAENRYFGKPCGLMDQTTSAVGGFVFIDFEDFDKPVVKKVEFDLNARGYSLVIVSTGGSHADLTDHYAAIENEMKHVAGFFGAGVLRAVPAERVIESTAKLRGKVSDRAILRALHFYADDNRVVAEVEALRNDRVDEFLCLVNESGRSSWMLLQNCYVPDKNAEQGIPLALEMSRQILAGDGACRVHGGGFAGTIQVFVPVDKKQRFFEEMQKVFGEDSCHEVMVRQNGAGKIVF